MEFEYFFSVRGYELDSFGHVNNAVYLNYIEQAQWEMLKKTDTFSFLRENRIIPAIVEINIRYIREAKIFDEMVVKSKVVFEPPYLVFVHNMYRQWPLFSSVFFSLLRARPGVTECPVTAGSDGQN